MAVPRFDDLSVQQCEELLGRAHVGRLAFALHDAVDIVPIGFVYKDNRIYGRTSPGGKLATIGRNRRVAFEVDEVSGAFEWKSVVVHGTFYVFDAGAGEMHDRLAAIFPDAMDVDDPVAFRNQFFSITVETVTGRSAAAAAGERKRVVPGNAHVAQLSEVERDIGLREEVVTEITRITRNRNENVRCAVQNGIVILSGSVSDTGLRSDIEASVASLPGVHAIVQEIEVEWPLRVQPTPAEIALRAGDVVAKSLPASEGHVVAVYENGWLRLEGHASPGGRDQVLRSLHHMPGSRGLIDRIRTTHSEG